MQDVPKMYGDFMNNKQIHKIADATNTSVATVSKVINHCYGVSSELRERVFLQSDKLVGKQTPKKPVMIYVIIPEVPNFFWNCELLSPKNPEITIKYNCYSRLGDDNTVIRYLNEAISLNADVIIIATQNNAEIENTVRNLANDKLIIFLTEQHNIVNTFYVGSNPEKDGEILAENVLKHHDRSSKMLVLRDISPNKNTNSSSRFNAFIKTVDNKIAFDVFNIALKIGSPSFASSIAMALSPAFEKEHYSSIAFFNGFAPNVCCAIQKLKLPYKVNCFGFENSPQNQKWADAGFLKVVISQNFKEQLETALAFAEQYIKTQNYPNQKYTFVNSDLIEY